MRPGSFNQCLPVLKADQGTQSPPKASLGLDNGRCFGRLVLQTNRTSFAAARAASERDCKALIWASRRSLLAPFSSSRSLLGASAQLGERREQDRFLGR